MAKFYTKYSDILFRDSRKELYLYLALWLLLLLTPLFSIYLRLSGMPAATLFPWDELLLVWRQYALFLAMFLVHNYLLAPLLVYRQKRGLYFSALAALLAVFVAVQCSNRPAMDDRDHTHPAPHAMDEGRPLGHGDGPKWGLDDRGRHPGPPPMDDMHRPPLILGEHDIVATIIFILMIGMNLGIKLYFRQQKDNERLMKLENDNLEQQLEYLKYQINPHFLMNTLNNIHALVDIEPEQAKETIVELSKIMRFVLYEGSKQKVPVRQELMFLENYIELMKMRYSDQVKVSVSLPDMLPDREIPPLLLITFVENAFKHGVSYQKESFVDIDISIADNLLTFRCANSKAPKNDNMPGGVGLENARRRLDLLYGGRHSLDISETDNEYTVTLKLPL